MCSSVAEPARMQRGSSAERALHSRNSSGVHEIKIDELRLQLVGYETLRRAARVIEACFLWQARGPTVAQPPPRGTS